MAIENKNWYQIDNIDELDSPVLIVFPERVKANIQTAISMVADVSRLRPHVKTNKSAEATQLMLDTGITKFKCATIAEAEMLGMIKAPDVVLAYQPLGPKLYRFIELVRNFPLLNIPVLLIIRLLQKNKPMHLQPMTWKYLFMLT